MNQPFIERLRISNFRSIETIELGDLHPLSVFAGANGSGKTNFIDALAFLQQVLVSGASEAIRAYGGLEHIRNTRGRGNSDEHVFGLDIACMLPPSFEGNGKRQVKVEYALNLYQTAQGPVIEERLAESGKELFNRPRARNGTPLETAPGLHVEIPIRPDYSLLSMFNGISFAEFARNIRIYRIDPVAAAAPSENGGDDTELDINGRNLAAVLARIESNAELRETILEWIELIVPSVDAVRVQPRHLDQRAMILFEEEYADRPFPAGMVSQGTLYALSLLVAILDKPSPLGLTLIEEPERGLHPKAIGELIGLMREVAGPNTGIWVTTHSESVVKHTRLDELWLLDKKEGHTTIKHASDTSITQESLGTLTVDDAWLSNLLGAGLPW